MIGLLGRPIRACHDHVDVLNCSERCLGVELGDLEEMGASEHPGCAVCRIQPGESRRSFRVLRKCQRQRCYGRFRRDAYDDTYIDEYIAVAKRWLARVFRRGNA